MTSSKPNQSWKWSGSAGNQLQYCALAKHVHTHTHNCSTTQDYQGGRYQKIHSHTHIHPDHQTSFINFLHLLRSIASTLSNLRAWQSFSTTTLQVLFGLPLGLEPPLHTSYFTQSLSCFHNTCPPCPYHHNLFCYSTATGRTVGLCVTVQNRNLQFTFRNRCRGDGYEVDHVRQQASQDELGSTAAEL